MTENGTKTPRVPRVTSIVYPAPKEWWQFSFLIPHEQVRRLLEQGEEIAKNLDPIGKPWQAALFAKWYTGSYYRYIHAHHDIEETIYFPWVETKTVLPERLAADHTTLLAMLADVEKQLPDLQSSDKDKCSAAAKEIARLLLEISADMRPHLDEEERSAQTTLKDNFTQQEEAKIIQAIVKYTQKTGNAEFELAATYDAATEWMTDEQLAAFAKQLPPPVRLLLKKIWHPKYVKQEKKWAKDLLTDAEPAVDDSGCGICAIM